MQGTIRWDFDHPPEETFLRVSSPLKSIVNHIILCVERKGLTDRDAVWEQLAADSFGPKRNNLSAI